MTMKMPLGGGVARRRPLRLLTSNPTDRGILILALIPPLVGGLLLAGCGNGDGPHSQDDPANRGQNGPRAMRPVPVAIEPVSRGSIASYHTATATLDPDKQADILARVSGIVLELAAEEGDRVRENGLLLRIEDDEYRARLREAEAEEAKQRSRFERVQKMFKQDLVSAEEHESVRNDLQAAESAREISALQLSYTSVRAPFDGRIVQRFVDPGQTVSEGTSLFTLADMRRLLARVHVPAKEFRNIRTDQPVEITIDSSRDLLSGKITLVSPVIDPTSGTIKVTIEITDYPQTTRPGDFAEVRIVTDRHTEALLVPKSAVISDKGEQVVFVAADSTAERRVVEIGFQDDRRIEISGGLREGERIVVQGQRSLKDGQPLHILQPTRFEDTDGERAGS